jgi:hypothetical protein
VRTRLQMENKENLIFDPDESFDARQTRKEMALN